MLIIICKIISLLPFITLVRLIRGRRENSPTRGGASNRSPQENGLLVHSHLRRLSHIKRLFVN